ncbi:cytosine deaminase [Nocardiopsis terrae]|uniref:Cytosine/adenosine deaminase-related metal-dependent hydrolase n=1 Tax=Nocardiopsis terrae TaxID=372655 RepID=A0ABR9HIK3_9ACTN|nr:amidohydrolase [Nocardiopsis terrae]MBE1458849.1 cytosine/adenosine deaminase-related metal-dependent hydrolase [Nocardiopsis terrae]GHC86703.1 cytosine deaminase [Nocardiopsis terrae]
MTDQPRTTIFRDLRPMGGAAVDLVVSDGLVAGSGPRGGALSDGTEHTVDCGGRIALPTLVDAHIHPDKTTWGEPWHSRRPARGIAELGAQDAELFRSLPTPVAVRAERLMAHAVTRGTRAMRAHADVAPVFGLEGLEGVRRAADRLSHALDVRTVAFPQHGVRRSPGTDSLLEEAVRTGTADLVGGIDPEGFDGDPDGQLDLVFGIADRHRVGVDVHLHDDGPVGSRTLWSVVERTRALDMGGNVTVSHAFGVAGAGEEFDALAAALGEAGIALTTVAPDPARVLPLARLRAHGVRVGVGSDGVRDSWSPFGDADMLHRTHLLARALRARLDEDLSDAYLTAAHTGAGLVGLPVADLSPGAPADFLLVEGECLPQVVVDVPQRHAVVRAGRVVARQGRLV